MDLQAYKSKLPKKQLELLTAVETGTLAKVRKLTRECQHLMETDDLFGYLLVVIALHRKHKSISKHLIKEGWTVKVPQKTGTYSTPLYYAVKIDDFELFKMLQTKGASLHDKDANEVSALELALESFVHERRWDIIKFLLDTTRLQDGSEDLKQNSEDDIALFHAACMSSNAAAVQIFISKGFSVNSRSSFTKDEWRGFTPLHFAFVSEGLSLDRDASVFKILLKHNDLNFFAQDNRGRTIAHMAMRDHSYSILEDETVLDRLFRPAKGDSINPTDVNGLNLLHILCFMRFREQYAVEHMKSIKFLIDSKVDVNSSVSFEDDKYPGYTALHFAVLNLSLDMLRLLLENGADPKKTTKNGTTPLHMVCGLSNQHQKLRFEIIKLLLHYGADPIAKDSENQTPFHRAFYEQSDSFPFDECKKVILSQVSLSIDYTDNNGLSYLHMACTGDDPDIVETLIANGAQINSCIKSDLTHYLNYSPLHFAVRFDKLNLVELLLARGADANCVGDTKVTPLHLACENDFSPCASPGLSQSDPVKSRINQIGIIELLLKHGASVNAQDSSGLTPILKTVQIFDRNTFGNPGMTDCMFDELLTRQKKIVDILVNHGADMHITDNQNRSVLHILICNYWKSRTRIKDLIEVILKRGFNLNAFNNLAMTPLHIAVDETIQKMFGIKLVELLLKYNADVNSETNAYDSPILMVLADYPCSPSEREVFEFLLKHEDINLKARNMFGEVPLHIAVRRGKPFHTDKLLKCGADINIEHNEEYPATDYAVESLYRMPSLIDDEIYCEIVKILIMHVKKLLKFRFSVSGIVQHHINLLSQYLSRRELALMDSEIEREAESLKSKKLDEYTSFYDILFENPHEMAKHVQKRELEASISSIRYGSDLTFFGGLIKRQFDKGCKRFKLLKPAKKILDSITKMNWPDCCADRILSLFSNRELKVLMDTKIVLDNRKRPASDPTLFDNSLAKISRCE